MFGRQLTGAQLLNPMQAAQSAQQGNQSVFNSTALQNSFWSNLVGGLVGGAAGIAGAPFGFKKGGKVPHTGMHLLHKGEVVLNKKQQKKHLTSAPKFSAPEPAFSYV